MASPFVAGNGSPKLAAGRPGIVTIIAEAKQIDSSGSLAVIVRNNTDQSVARVTAAGTIQTASGRLLATGSDQGFQPNLVAPGEITTGYIYFQNMNLKISPGDKVSIQLGSTPSNENTYENERDLRPTHTTERHGEFGLEVLGQVVNQYPYKIAGPVSVRVTCFAASGELLGTDDDFASPDDLAPGQVGSYTVTLYSPPCPVYLVTAQGFTS